MIVFFAIVGCIGCCVGLGQRGGCCDGVHAPYCGDCYWCVWCDCNHHNCDCPSNCNCGDCDCSGKCDGDGGAALLLIAAVICIILAFVGLILALFFMAMVVQRIMQRHMHVLQKRTLAAHYLVLDLNGKDPMEFSRPNDEIVNMDAPGMAELPPEYAPSAPPAYSQLSPPEYSELKEAGLI